MKRKISNSEEKNYMYNQRSLITTVLFIFSLLILLTAIPVAAKKPKKMSTEKLEEFLVVANDPQGLTWAGQHLWLADDDTNTLYKINPSGGKIIKSIPSPGPWPRGLAWDGKDLWCSDSKTEKIYQLDPKSGEVISSIDAPVSNATNAPLDSVRGLAWDGNYLWSAYYAGWGSQICKVDPQTGIVDKSFFPGGIPQALTCDGKYLYCVNNNNYLKKMNYDKFNFVKRFNLSDIVLSGFIEIPSLNPRGLSVADGMFWHVDRGTKRMCKLKVKN